MRDRRAHLSRKEHLRGVLEVLLDFHYVKGADVSYLPGPGARGNTHQGK